MSYVGSTARVFCVCSPPRLFVQVAMWSEGCYLNNFVQGVLDTFPQEELKGSTIIVSGDGR